MLNKNFQNICRICKKVFCCKKCRKQHESLIHKIFVDCNICLYGKTFLKDPPEHLIEHIKSNHWPLHCVICKYTFTSLGELLEQNKCVETKNQDLKRSPYTPIQSQDESPLYFSKEQKAITSKSMFPNVATSTPLQRQEDNNLPEKNNEEVITPVDFSDINKDKKYFTDSVSIKRKVTFCETPITDIYEKQKELLRPGMFLIISKSFIFMYEIKSIYKYNCQLLRFVTS